MSDLFGNGFTYPLVATSAGRLKETVSEDILFESIQSIFETPIGTAPLDPGYGNNIEIYDPIQDRADVAWEAGRAIERCEPRIANVIVTIVDADFRTGTLLLDIGIEPIGQNVRFNRTFPFFRKVTA